MIRAVHVILALGLVACSDKGSPSSRTDDAGGVEKRVFRPRPGRVRAPPPHNIHEGGIGPYKLGASRKAIYKILPQRPSVELLNIDRVVDYSLVRTEQDGLLIGTSRRSGAQFLVAIDAEIAHTERGPIIGLSVDEIESVAGEQAVHSRATDPRIRVHVGLPNTRILTDRHRVEAVVVAPDSEVETTPEPDPTDQDGDDYELEDAGTPPSPRPQQQCRRVPRMRAKRDEIVKASRISMALSPDVAYGCGSQGLAVVSVGSHISIVSNADTRPKRTTGNAIDGLVFAAPLDVDGDGADEIAAVTRHEREDAVTFRVELFETNMTPLASRDAYELQAETIRWVGAERLEDTDLLLELHSPAPGQVQIGGIYTQRSGANLHNVAPLKTKVLRVRRPRPAPPPSPDAGLIRVPPLPPPPDAAVPRDPNPKPR